MEKYLGVEPKGVRMLMRYDIENLSDETYKKACGTVFAEPPVDVLLRHLGQGLAVQPDIASIRLVEPQQELQQPTCRQCHAMCASAESRRTAYHPLGHDLRDKRHPDP